MCWERLAMRMDVEGRRRKVKPEAEMDGPWKYGLAVS